MQKRCILNPQVVVSYFISTSWGLYTIISEGKFTQPESTIRFITYYANNVALWEAGKEAKLVSKICAEDIVKDLCMSGTLAVPILVKDYLRLKNPDVAGEGAKISN